MLINKWNVTSYDGNSWIRRFIGLTGLTQGSNGQCQWIYPKHFYPDSWRKSCWQLTSMIDIENIHKWYCIIRARNTHNLYSEVCHQSLVKHFVQHAHNTRYVCWPRVNAVSTRQWVFELGQTGVVNRCLLFSSFWMFWVWRKRAIRKWYFSKSK